MEAAANMNAPHELMQDTVAFTLNGAEVTAAPDETIIQAADRAGVAIPRLCYKPGMRPDGNCRACMVEIKGERALAPACCRKPAPGMDVKSDSARAVHSQKLVVELLSSDMPEKVYKPADELAFWRRKLGVGKPRFPSRQQPPADLSHPAMAVNLDACIQCTRCVRACREVQVNDVIGYAYRSEHALPVFDLGDPMGASRAWRAASACRLVPRARWRRRTRRISSRSTRRSSRCVPTAASAARSRTTSRATRSCGWRAARASRTWSGCASRAVSASTTCRIRIASPSR
jgi:ferredoxin/NAD-dependent dihydropyrimidine dehydrogenase PreA subunit